MLYANKQDVEADLRVQLLQIREHELRFYASNCRTIGTQASVFAGFAFSFFEVAARFEGYDVVREIRANNLTGLAEDTAAARAYQTPESLRVLFVLSATCAMALNVSAMFFANCLALFGPGLALRGDGSEAMDRAVDGLALEYRVVFLVFFLGIVSFFGVAVLYSLMQADWVLSTCVVAVLVYLLRHTMHAFKRLYKKFRLPPALAQSGAFNRHDGGRVVDPLVQAAQIAALSRHAQWLERLSQRKRWLDWPLRQYLYMRLFFDDFVGVSAEIFEMRYSSYVKDSAADDGITRVVLRSIESRAGEPERAVDYARRAHSGGPPSVELANVELGAAVLRKQPWGRFGRAAAAGNGGEGRAGLLGDVADSSSLSHARPPGPPTAELAPPDEFLPPHGICEAGAGPARGAAAGTPGSSAEHAGAAGFEPESGRAPNLSLSSRASGDGAGVGGVKRWDVGGWLVERGESWLQRL